MNNNIILLVKQLNYLNNIQSLTYNLNNQNYQSTITKINDINKNMIRANQSITNSDNWTEYILNFNNLKPDANYEIVTTDIIKYISRIITQTNNLLEKILFSTNDNKYTIKILKNIIDIESNMNNDNNQIINTLENDINTYSEEQLKYKHQEDLALANKHQEELALANKHQEELALANNENMKHDKLEKNKITHKTSDDKTHINKTSDDKTHINKTSDDKTHINKTSDDKSSDDTAKVAIISIIVIILCISLSILVYFMMRKKSSDEEINDDDT